MAVAAKFSVVCAPVRPLVYMVSGREQQIGGSGGSLEPPGPLLEPPGPLLTHLHTVYIAYSDGLPTRLNPLAERTYFSQVSGATQRPGHVRVNQRLVTMLEPAGASCHFLGTLCELAATRPTGVGDSFVRAVVSAPGKAPPTAVTCMGHAWRVRSSTAQTRP
jgi:hypothetical protein